MTIRDFNHLDATELDLWLDEQLSASRLLHVETCLECTGLVDAERELFDRFARLPLLAPTPRFTDRVLASLAVRQPALALARRHLDAAELDLWLDGGLTAARLWHVADCEECRTLAETERRLVARLTALPLYSPAARFPDRVMRSVTMAPAHGVEALRRRVFASRESMGVAAALTILVAASMSASVAWSLTHREVITGLTSRLSAQAGEWLWIGLRAAAGGIVQQPWYAAVRETFAAPGRLATGAALATVAYAGGIFALRRLTTHPRVEVARAEA